MRSYEHYSTLTMLEEVSVGVKRLMGSRFSDSTVKKDINSWPFKVIEGSIEKPMIVVKHKYEEKKYSPEDISCITPKNMKEVTEAFLGTKVTDSVITVPAYFNVRQRQATKDVGWDTSWSQLDLGGGTFDVLLLNISKGGDTITVKAIGGDTHLGGEDFDMVIMNHCVQDLRKRNFVDVNENARAIVKRIFRYLKHQPKLGLWYPRDSPFELEAYSDSDYGGASLDRKSTTGGCQFLGRRLISWQCKKQTIVANSTTEAEYVAAANCCGQVLWIQNQMMDYGFNFMNTKIHIDNESTISVIKNPVAHSRTKHIEIRFHFIRDCYEKRLIEVIKIHTDHNVADLLTKGFDVTRFNFLVVSIGLLNLESLERDIDGTEELLLPDLLILWLTKVSTDSAKLVPLGKDSTAIKPLEKIPLRTFLHEAPFTVLSLYITAKVAGKPMNISEASIRSDLLFYDADGIDSLHNQAIFDAIKPMRHLDAKKKFVMYPRFIPVFLTNQLKNMHVPLDHFPINALTTKVFSFMVKKGKSFSRNVTPLFPSMLAQPTKDEGATVLVGIMEVITQATQIKDLKSQIKQLKKKAKLLITHHKAWMKSISMKQRLVGKESLKKKWMQKEFISKQGRKPAKSEPTGRKSSVVLEEKESIEKGVSTEDPLSTAQPKVSTDKPEVSTAKPKEVKVSTDKLDEGTAEPKDETSDESTAPITVFRDDETIAEFLVSMSQNKAKQKGIEIKDADDSDRPRATSTRSVLTLKPLPKIDPKDKGNKVLEEEAESDAESEGVDEAERKFDQLAKDEEIARKVQEDWEAEEEMKKLAEEEATKAALIQDFDDIQARIEADRLLAARLQEEERETFTVEERAKFLYDTIAAQRRFLAQQRAAAIRSRPPTRTQLRNQMMTYLKHVGGKKHADLKNKNFEEIQVLYKKVKRSDKDFIAIGSAEDERQIKEMNEESKDPKKKRLKKRVVNETPREEDTAKVPAEQEVTEQGTKKRKSGHVKMIARKRPRPQPDDDSDDEHRKCLRIVTFDSTIDSEIMETKSFVSKLHKVSSPDGDYLVVYRVNGHFRAFNYLMEVLHIFDRQDLFHLYDLVMKQYLEITPEDWEIVSWRLYEACRVCILELKDGTVIYMLVERRYPLSKELLQRMLDLGLEVEEEIKSWLVQDQTVPVQKQTAFGKDKSNPLIVDSLLKTIRLSIHLVVYNEELAIPEQTATGKGISNPLMAGSLPKTTKPT
ncbi:putative ribonuclease H-like domain-containing protein [Tanacetum coccineum]